MKKSLSNDAVRCQGWYLFRFMGIVNKKSLLFIILFLNISAFAFSQKISINMGEVTLGKALKEIRDKTKVTFFYSEEEIDLNRKVRVNFTNTDVKDIVSKLVGKDFKVEKQADKFYLIVPTKPVSVVDDVQQSVVVTGRVVDTKANPIPGVTVQVLRNKTTVLTDIDGKYSITAMKGDKLQFSFIGYLTVEKIVDQNKLYDIILEEEVSKLNEVVVTGYYDRKKESFTGAETTIKGKDLTAVTSQNLLAALAIVAPSFKLVENNSFGSDPNRMPDFTIRGGSSINSDLNSEYKNNPNLPTFILDGFEVKATVIFDLDPNRVESITVLRDASATAIYGSRAANGVVVITTKRPEKGMMNIKYNANLDFVAADLSDYNLMNASEKLEYERLAGLYSSDVVYVNELYQQRYNERLKLVQQGINTDWIAIPVRKLGVDNTHSLFLEGGDDHFLYSFNVNHKETVGAMKGSDRVRNGLSIKLQHNREKLRFANTVSFNRMKANNSKYGTFSQYTYMNPYYYPYDENGRVKENLYINDSGVLVPNMLYNSTLNSKDSEDYNEFVNNFSFSWDISKALKLTSRIGLVYKKSNTDQFLPAENTAFANTTVKGRYYKAGTDESSYDGNLVLAYNKLVNKKHLFNVNGIYNINEDKVDSFSFIGENYPNSNLDHVSMGTQYQTGGTPGGNYFIRRLMGVVGAFNYAYDNRFLLDFSVRSDASSVFGANDRWATFKSGGIGWNIHKEKFLEKISAVDLLKVRASLGETGGTNFNPYQSYMMYNYKDSSLDNLTYNGSLGAVLMALGNPDLKWQKNVKLNIGFDFAFFNNRLSGNYNYYNQVSQNQLINLTLAPSVGFPTYTENLGKVRNEGIELSLKYVLIDSKKSNFNWSIFTNVIHNENTLMDINDALTAFNDRQDESALENGITSTFVKFVEGQSTNTIWAVESRGIDPATGKEIFVDKDGNLTNTYSFKDQKPMAVQDPKLEGNFGTQVFYNGFELGAYFGFKYGGYLYNQTLVDKVENVDPRQNADKRVLYDRWKTPGDDSLFKAITNTSKTYPTSRFIQKDDEIRFTSLNLSYNFDTELVKRWGLRRLRVSAISNDLFRLNSAKIERGTSYPFARTFSLNVQVSL